MLRYIIALLMLLPALCLPAWADYSPEKDYMLIMMEAVCSGETGRGREAEVLRGEKISALGLDYPIVSYDDLEALSKLIEIEAGSRWLSREWKMAVGEVVLNRVASPEFPNSISGVIGQPGQYSAGNSLYFRSLLPSPESVEAAKRLLEGERVICDPSVVFQANFAQGSSVHTTLYDPLLGYTYLCCSNYPEYYG